MKLLHPVTCEGVRHALRSFHLLRSAEVVDFFGKNDLIPTTTAPKPHGPS